MACCGSRAANVGTLIVGRRHARAEVWGAYRSLRLGQTDGPLSPGHSRHLRDVVAASLPTAMRFCLRRNGLTNLIKDSRTSPQVAAALGRADLVRPRAERRQAACHPVRAVPELPVADRCRRGEATAARPTGPTEESDCRVRSSARRKHRPTWLCPWPYSAWEGAAKRAHRVGVRAIWSSG